MALISFPITNVPYRIIEWNFEDAIFKVKSFLQRIAAPLLSEVLFIVLIATCQHLIPVFEGLDITEIIVVINKNMSSDLWYVTGSRYIHFWN